MAKISNSSDVVADVDAVVEAPARDNKPKREKKAKKERVERVAYEGAKLESEVLPADYDPAKHKPLKKANFVAEHVFMRYKASQLEQVAAKLRKNADELEKLGGGAAGGKAKKVVAMYQKMKELAAALGDDIDLEELLGSDVAAALKAD